VAVTKTEVVSVRVPPDVKEALIAAAEQERRSLASMLEFMVLDYCKTRGISAEQAPIGKLAKSASSVERNGTKK
jgi:hypothetical protein